MLFQTPLFIRNVASQMSDVNGGCWNIAPRLKRTSRPSEPTTTSVRFQPQTAQKRKCSTTSNSPYQGTVRPEAFCWGRPDLAPVIWM
jgi:hypothetical protein